MWKLQFSRSEDGRFVSESDLREVLGLNGINWENILASTAEMVTDMSAEASGIHGAAIEDRNKAETAYREGRKAIEEKFAAAEAAAQDKMNTAAALARKANRMARILSAFASKSAKPEEPVK